MRNFILTGLLAMAAGAFLGAPARAQYGAGGYGGMGGYGGYGGMGGAYGGMGNYGGGPYAPNFYNPQNQPLSPYLNLLRGSNAAVNYYYGARPGLPSGGYMMPYGISPGMMGGRQSFFPVVDTLYEQEEGGTPVGGGLPPTGHAFGFNNTLGYFGIAAASGAGPGGTRNFGRSQQGGQGGQSRPSSGASGTSGASTPPTTTR